MKHYFYVCDGCGKRDNLKTKEYEYPEGWFSGWVDVRIKDDIERELDIEACSYKCLLKVLAKHFLSDVSTLEQ